MLATIKFYRLHHEDYLHEHQWDEDVAEHEREEIERGIIAAKAAEEEKARLNVVEEEKRKEGELKNFNDVVKGTPTPKTPENLNVASQVGSPLIDN